MAKVHPQSEKIMARQCALDDLYTLNPTLRLWGFTKAFQAEAAGCHPVVHELPVLSMAWIPPGSRG